jgi:coenzyme F420-reducing hydrogenase delta subunit
MGIDPKRLRLAWISASEGKQFAQLADDMTKTILGLGPCEVKQVMETLA